MAEENKNKMKEEIKETVTEEIKETVTEEIKKPVESKEEATQDSKSNEKNMEEKTEPKKEESKKKKEKEIPKKEFAVGKATSLRISQKDSIAICRVIKGKTPEFAIKRLEDVLKKKRVIPMKTREVPHQKGHGVAGARFPKKASEEIIKVVKQVQANALVSGIENPVITLAIANQAPRPFRRGGTQGKRTHIQLEVRDKTKLIKEKK